MKRDPRCSIYYWDKWSNYTRSSIEEKWREINIPGDRDYLPQYVYGLFKDYYEEIIMWYSRGDAVKELGQYFERMLDAWELSEKLGKDVWSDDTQYTRHAWEVNLDHYIRCFWLTGLALALDISENLWQRLVVLMGNEGQDALLDQVIASRQKNRKIGEHLCFPKAYKNLYQVTQASQEKQPVLLHQYLQEWLPSLENAGSKRFPKDFRTPYWWAMCIDETRGLEGGYFGCWCIEAAAVVKAFKIDDTLCLDHPYYPGDLIQDGRSPRYPDVPSPYEPPREEEQDKSTKQGFFSRLFKKR